MLNDEDDNGTLGKDRFSDMIKAGYVPMLLNCFPKHSIAHQQYAPWSVQVPSTAKYAAGAGRCLAMPVSGIFGYYS